ncbi:UNVERIFIED_CONTAM: hypothetical protein H355_000865 [Colinus virginianus]|nr:hypothetical protein H355_000865 [Colinus virginianus]
MSREKGGPTYRALLRVLDTYPGLQLYTLTEEKMAYCDAVFQNETGKNRCRDPAGCPPSPQSAARVPPHIPHGTAVPRRVKSGSFLSTGWFTMILAMELCERICVFGMVSDSYCRCGAAGGGGGCGGPALLSPHGARREKNHSSVPYHYFEKGRLDECRMYLVHERAPRAGHRFITEKAIFSRWAKRRDIIFTHPSWAGG